MVFSRASDRLYSFFLGERLRARTLRSLVFAVASFGGANFLRLASNLILTRLLFPEAFGLMAMVQVVMVGLEMISDTGVQTSIVQNRRGDEASFLNTAWSIQIARGVLLWLIVLLISNPVAQFYGQPMLAQLLPIAGMVAILKGFESTKLATANRKLVMGRMTMLELGSQMFGILIMIILAIWTQSVWALVLGGLLGATLKMILSHSYLPGPNNHLQWDKTAFHEIFHFGKYIFVASLAGFLINHGDRAILGKFVSLTELAVYNIGFFLATVPMMMSYQLGGKILLPLYSAILQGSDLANQRKAMLARAGLTSAMLAFALLLGLAGDWLIRHLYLPEYHLAGPIMVLLSLAYMPVIAIAAYGALLLATGDSLSFTLMAIVSAAVKSLFLFVGISNFGVIGAIAAPPLATLIVYPLTALLVHRHGCWNPRLDLAFFVFMLAASALTLWINDTAIAQVLAGVPD
ncbi:MAG: oligosaccharide flippase family protein [Alphaproteobacteria bacterium]|nr:oligosaccharide flippase family protein [Alphaproteobacteria bacterium]